VTPNFKRGAKFGALSAVGFAVVIPLNQLLRSEPVSSNSTVVGTVFAFILFGVIGSLTDRIGSDFGDA
jgi:RsiW-degrading membrane proteinase PrsW (M82 family)